uniref:Transcriptional regulator, TetR family n=1 Tax=Cyanothece sp. (strain PCC 7425 / ATCC 29141) TaxID=395961 RepID=B8HKR0_CYAP4
MSPLSTRQRLIQAALELFLSQGISNTTTRQIANLAEVNEVTLFRQFGNKYGLLLAVVEESPTFTQLGTVLNQHLAQTGSVGELLHQYASIYLQTLQRVPDFVRSLIGEAEQFPPPNRQAIATQLSQMNRVLAEALTAMLPQMGQAQLDPTAIATLLQGLVLGYAVIELTTDQLPLDREVFLDHLVHLFLQGALAERSSSDLSPSSSLALALPASLPPLEPDGIADLPPPLVHRILQKARETGLQDYALAYVLFATGLSVEEIARLHRVDQISDPQQHLLQVSSERGGRSVPVNQWILGKRYGSYTNNPLTKWLKSRKDEHPALFVDRGEPLSVTGMIQLWQGWTAGLQTLGGKVPAIAQAEQTWCVEMLMRGISVENLSLLTSWEPARLQPYVQRAREKLALEQALQLDRKSPGSQAQVGE